MSYSFRARKKNRKKLKKAFGKLWLTKYQEFLGDLEKEKHPSIGTLEDVLKENNDNETTTN